MELTSLEYIAERAKRRKSDREAALHAYETFVSMVPDQLARLPRETRDCWLVARYGVQQVLEAQRVLGTVPHNITNAQRVELINELGRENAISENSKINEVITFMEMEEFEHLSLIQPSGSQALVLTPPTKCCYECKKNLVSNHRTQVKCYSTTGCTRGIKYTLRCRDCGVTYNYSQFGDKTKTGFRLYSTEREYIEASDTIFFCRQLVEWQCSLANHSWVSFQGFAESYNTAVGLSADQELSPHIVAEAFYNGEVESELRRLDKADFRMFRDCDRDRCMDMIEELRRQTIYSHDTCAAECKKRGCGSLWVTDGIWKTVFPHCMFKVQQTVAGLPALNLPDVCTQSPGRGKAFCAEHCKLLAEEAADVPHNLREFLKYCGAKTNTTSRDDIDLCHGDVDKVDAAVNSITLKSNTVGQTAAASQGTSSLIQQHPQLIQGAVYADSTESLCRKNTGKSKSLRKWSRGRRPHRYLAAFVQVRVSATFSHKNKHCIGPRCLFGL